MGRKIQAATWVSVGVLTGVLATFSLQTLARNTIEPLPLKQLQQFAAVYGLIKTDYVEPVDGKKLIDDAIAGMVSGLDPHSQYFDAESFKEFRADTSGHFVGVGIEISQEDGMIRIVSPIEGSPAARAGLLPNDLITQIDGKSVKQMGLVDAVKHMRGEPGTKVTLTIFRPSDNRTFKVEITREEIKTQSVRGGIVEPGYAWVRISQFQDNTVHDFVKKIDEIYAQDPKLKGLVLDLRNDPGGLLESAVAVSAAFLPRNEVVVTTDGQLPDSKAVFKTNPADYMSRRTVGGDPLRSLPPALKTVPLVVLVNDGSASASEIVAGALKDHKRAIIMGSRTFGKGSVQTVRPLGPDTGIKLTTAFYYTPSGKSIQGKGIEPNILLDDTAEGSPYAALRVHESDLIKHLNAGGADSSGPTQTPAELLRKELERTEALERWEKAQEANGGKPPRRLPTFGTPEDFQLQQALNELKGLPVKVAKPDSDDVVPAAALPKPDDVSRLPKPAEKVEPTPPPVPAAPR